MTTQTPTQPPPAPPHPAPQVSIDHAPTVELAAMLGEFTDVDVLMEAARAIRRAGYKRWDVHSPFPIHGIDRVMGIKPTILPWICLAGGLTGLLTGIGLEAYTMAFDYPYMISGKPYMSGPAFVPVIFELTVLFSALATVFGMLLLNRLPTLYLPVFRSDRFRRVTSDRFFIVIDAKDYEFDDDQTERLLKFYGAVAVERVEDVIA
jgi:hypothetical protein